MSATVLSVRAARADGVVIAAALTSGVCGAVHASLVPAHARESLVLGAAFLAAAVLQVAWAVRVSRGAAPAVVRAGVLLQLGIAAGWLLSRTAGLPVGAHPWTPEPVGALDLLTTWAEVLTAGLLLAPHAAGAEAVRRATLVLAAVLTCVLVSGMGAH